MRNVNDFFKIFINHCSNEKEWEIPKNINERWVLGGNHPQNKLRRG